MASKAVSLVKGFNQELTCPVCLELFKTPKTLPCLHTFCEECLKGVLEKCIDKPKGALECPTCRTQHDLPPKGVEGFTTNFTTINLVEILTIHGTVDTSPGTTASVLVIKCEDGIDDNPAATKCLDCNFYLCEECTAIHKKHRATRNHTLATLAELKEGGAKQLERKRYCADHEGEELKLYCRTCQEVICRDCAIVTHKPHDYTFIKDVREELTKKIESLMANVSTKEARYQELLECVQCATEKEKQKLDTEKAEANKFFDKHVEDLQNCIASLQKHRDTVLSDLAQASDVHMKQLLADEESLQFSRTRFTSALSFAEQLVSSATNTDLAMMSKQVINQLDTLSQQAPEKEEVDESQWVMNLQENVPLNSKVHLNACLNDTQSELSDYPEPELWDDAIDMEQNVTPLPKIDERIPLEMVAFPSNATIPAITPVFPKPQALLSEDNIVVSNLTDPALIGKNTFEIRIKDVHVHVKEPPDVKVILSPNSEECPVRIERSTDNSWLVKYFITAYPIRQSDTDRKPLPDGLFYKACASKSFSPTVIISVKVDGVESKDSPFKLELRKEMAVGTSVEYRKQGIVVVSHKRRQSGHESAVSKVDVKWGSHRHPAPKQYDIDQLKILVK